MNAQDLSICELYLTCLKKTNRNLQTKVKDNSANLQTSPYSVLSNDPSNSRIALPFFSDPKHVTPRKILSIINLGG